MSFFSMAWSMRFLFHRLELWDFCFMAWTMRFLFYGLESQIFIQSVDEVQDFCFASWSPEIFFVWQNQFHGLSMWFTLLFYSLNIQRLTNTQRESVLAKIWYVTAKIPIFITNSLHFNCWDLNFKLPIPAHVVQAKWQHSNWCPWYWITEKSHMWQYIFFSRPRFLGTE